MFRIVKIAGENILELTSANDSDWLQPEFCAILNHHCLTCYGNLPCQNENHRSCISNVLIYNDVLTGLKIIKERVTYLFRFHEGICALPE